MKKIIMVFLLMAFFIVGKVHAQDVEIVYKIPEEKFNHVYSIFLYKYNKKLRNPDYNNDGRPDWTKEKHLREILRFIIVKELEKIEDKEAAKRAKDDNRADFYTFR